MLASEHVREIISSTCILGRPCQESQKAQHINLLVNPKMYIVMIINLVCLFVETFITDVISPVTSKVVAAFAERMEFDKFLFTSIRTLDKTISNLEMKSVVDWSMLESIVNGSPISEEDTRSSVERKKCLMVVGVNTAFSCRERRGSVWATWMHQGENQKKLDEEKGIIIRFVIIRRSKTFFNDIKP
ncbi:probable beta-1,3-galactosyltransferase 2 isoform X1 [Tanacetum coccineum]